jgi:beta-glucosidase/6-phospho-beta-glucosidase/beta-galactosidase
MAEKCTKTSSPDSRLIEPKPFATLNHFTVPCSIVLPVSIVEFLLEESLRVMRGDAGWRNRPSTADQSN